MKTLLAFLSLLALAAPLAAQPIPVYLDPAADSPRIGSLETASLAVPASWPAGVDAAPGWRPVHYQGAFEVYAANNDIAKDLSVKPGRPYLLEPRADAPQLAVATPDDRSDVLSVDARFCKLRLETIVTGYVRADALQAAAPRPAAPRPSGEASGHAAQTKEIQGRLLRVGQFEKARVGEEYKLVDADGRSLAYLEVSQLPDLVPLRDLVGQTVRASGRLTETPEGHLVLGARSLKKAN